MRPATMSLERTVLLAASATGLPSIWSPEGKERCRRAAEVYGKLPDEHETQASRLAADAIVAPCA